MVEKIKKQYNTFSMQEWRLLTRMLLFITAVISYQISNITTNFAVGIGGNQENLILDT